MLEALANDNEQVKDQIWEAIYAAHTVYIQKTSFNSGTLCNPAIKSTPEFTVNGKVTLST